MLLSSRDTHGRPVLLRAKLSFCWMAWKHHPAGYLRVWIWEIAGVVAVLYAHSQLPWIALLGVAGAVMVLLGRAISAFPPVEFKR